MRNRCAFPSHSIFEIWTAEGAVTQGPRRPGKGSEQWRKRGFLIDKQHNQTSSNTNVAIKTMSSTSRSSSPHDGTENDEDSSLDLAMFQEPADYGSKASPPSKLIPYTLLSGRTLNLRLVGHNPLWVFTPSLRSFLSNPKTPLPPPSSTSLFPPSPSPITPNPPTLPKKLHH